MRLNSQRFLLARSAHAFISRIERRAFGQVSLLDPDIDDFCAILPRHAVKPDADIIHHIATFRAQQRGKLALAQLVAQRRPKDRAQCIRDIILGPRGYHHFQGIDNPEAGKGVDVQAQLIG